MFRGIVNVKIEDIIISYLQLKYNECMKYFHKNYTNFS